MQVVIHRREVTVQRRVNDQREGIGRITGIINTGRTCKARKLRITLSQIGESHNITVVVSSGTDSGAPHLYLGDDNRRTHQRKGGQILVIMVSKELVDKIMAVLIIFVSLDVEFVGLRTACHCNGL